MLDGPGDAFAWLLALETLIRDPVVRLAWDWAGLDRVSVEGCRVELRKRIKPRWMRTCTGNG